MVASLGGVQEARALAREFEAEGVSTRCKVWESAGVPAAWRDREQRTLLRREKKEI